MIQKLGPKVVLLKDSLGGLNRGARREARKAGHLLDGTSKKGALLPQHSDKRVELSRNWVKTIIGGGVPEYTFEGTKPGKNVQIMVTKKNLFQQIFGKQIVKDAKENTAKSIFETAKEAMDEMAQIDWKKAIKKRAKKIKKATKQKQQVKEYGESIDNIGNAMVKLLGIKTPKP